MHVIRPGIDRSGVFLGDIDVRLFLDPLSGAARDMGSQCTPIS
jgi:hypothetical protein